MHDEDRTRLLADLDHLLKSPLLSALRYCDAALRKDAPTREDVVLIRALCAKAWNHLGTARVFSRLVSNGSVKPNLALLSIPQFSRILRSAVQDASALDRNRSDRINLSIEVDDNSVIEVDIYLIEMVV